MHYLSFLDGCSSFDEAKKLCQDKNLVVKDYDSAGLYIIKYDKKTCDMSNEDVQKCRGVVLSKADNSLVCLVPSKSCSNDDFTKNFNNNTSNYTIQDFVDGTMINLFRFNGQPFISTRSCLNAHCSWTSQTTFADMFRQCLGSGPDKIDKIDLDYCYSFVIQHPENTIVKKYLVPDLVLTMVSKIGENGTVEYFDPCQFVDVYDLGFRTPTEYNFNKIEDVYGYVSSLSECEQGVIIHERLNSHTQKRTKIRNSKYDKIRHLKGSTNNKLYLFFELRKKGKGEYENYLNYFEEDRSLFDSYRQNLYDFTQRLFQNYLDCFANKDQHGNSLKNHKNIDYELKPLVAELHGDYLKTHKQTTKQTVIQYLHNLPVPRLIFALTYNKENAA